MAAVSSERRGGKKNQQIIHMIPHDADNLYLHVPRWHEKLTGNLQCFNLTKGGKKNVYSLRPKKKYKSHLPRSQGIFKFDQIYKRYYL
jgi:hypothetical protein